MEIQLLSLECTLIFLALLRVKLNKDNTRASDVICEKKGKLCNISVQIMWEGESIIQQIIAIFSEVTSHCFTKFEMRKIPFRLINIQLECKGTLKHVKLYKNPKTDFHFI